MSAPAVPQMRTTAFFLVNIALQLVNAAPWVIAFMLLQFLGIRLYTVREREVCKRIQKRVAVASHTSEDGKANGYVVGFGFFGHVNVDDDCHACWIIGTKAAFDTLTRETNQATPVTPGGPEPDAGSDMTVYERLGSFHSVWFKRRPFTTMMKPMGEQEHIVTSLQTAYAKKGHYVAFLFGPPGTGKSMIGVLLAAQTKGSYCNTLRPWQPGDTIAALYSEVEPTKEKPLIIAIDEVDTALMLIHTGIENHKHMPISVQNKTGWNRMLDEIGRGLYPHLILLMTSNRDPAFIRSLDPSYIREGRVNEIIGVYDKITV